MTDRAVYERMWGRFPELGRVLGEKRLTLRWTSPSVSDNVFDQLNRLLRTYALVEYYADDVDNALPGRLDVIRGELICLSEDLKRAADRFSEASRKIEERARSAGMRR